MAVKILRSMLSFAGIEATVPGDSSAFEVVAARDLSGHDKKCFTVKNTSGVPVDEVDVYASPKSPADALGVDSVDWEFIGTIAAPLAANSIVSFQVSGDSRRSWKIVAYNSVPNATVIGYVTAGSI